MSWPSLQASSLGGVGLRTNYLSMKIIIEYHIFSLRILLLHVTSISEEGSINFSVEQLLL